MYFSDSRTENVPRRSIELVRLVCLCTTDHSCPQCRRDDVLVQEGGQLHFLGSKLFANDWAKTVPMRATPKEMRRTGKRTQTRSCHGAWALRSTLSQHPRPPHAGELEKMKIHGIFIRLESRGIS